MTCNIYEIYQLAYCQPTHTCTYTDWHSVACLWKLVDSQPIVLWDVDQVLMKCQWRCHYVSIECWSRVLIKGINRNLAAGAFLLVHMTQKDYFPWFNNCVQIYPFFWRFESCWTVSLMMVSLTMTMHLSHHMTSEAQDIAEIRHFLMISLNKHLKPSLTDKMPRRLYHLKGVHLKDL